MIKKLSYLLLVLATLGFLASPVGATPYTISGSSGNLAASVTFETSGTDLIVTLTNTSTADVSAPSDVLTAVFFTIAGESLTEISAVLAPGSTVWYGGTDPGGVVGGEFYYAESLTGAPMGADQVISSAGLGFFGSTTQLFDGSNLQGPVDPDGLQYGLTSAGDDLTTGNKQVTGNHALIKNSVIFTLSGLSSSTFDPTSITDVSFQYGTDLSEPRIVPEPTTLFLFGTGLLGLAGLGRRKSKLFKKS